AELGVAVDVDDLEVERRLCLYALERRVRVVAKAAALARVQGDLHASVTPTALAIARNDVISCANSAGVSDWGPSQSAAFGLGCTSTITPSAPAANAALAMAGTKSESPVPCEGSTTIGRWVSRLMSGIDPRSSVLRVMGSKVRMPRSHKITS